MGPFGTYRTYGSPATLHKEIALVVLGALLVLTVVLDRGAQASTATTASRAHDDEPFHDPNAALINVTQAASWSAFTPHVGVNYKPSRDVLLYAFDEINAAGGVMGKKLKLEVGDDACDPKQARAVAEKFASAKLPFVAASRTPRIVSPAIVRLRNS